MKTNLLLLMSCITLMTSCKSDKKDNVSQDMTSDASSMTKQEETTQKSLEISPISHATMVLTYGDNAIYVDPTGGKEAFSEYTSPEIVMLTDIHGDHLDIETLKALDLSKATIVAPQAVVDQFPEDLKYGTLTVMNNGDTKTVNGYTVEAIPMYNLREEALKFHTKGRGNGYVVTLGDDRVYISGDTEDIPEMRNLKDIDIAFVCMNLPYTMPIESAVSAVLEFKPAKVYPYHYRGTEGLSDVDKFKTLVNQGDESIEVVQLNWYE
ncbi:MBL fold metallo-hydrolase [Sediminibacter sp. Hel_I_10]|uniref:MBL fold metallo-hydrolase n=1 Tax=Sediminibacter sp. Hel_I_10 TaxID=1392490 RepID=UPI00047CC2D9|nr:MBL fold metallo-hydrolase [Sediminibacter sp. Hel_I_10]